MAECEWGRCHATRSADSMRLTESYILEVKFGC